MNSYQTFGLDRSLITVFLRPCLLNPVMEFKSLDRSGLDEEEGVELSVEGGGGGGGGGNELRLADVDDGGGGGGGGVEN